MKYTFKLNGLDCAVCASKVEIAVKQVPGVAEAHVHFITQKLNIVLQPDAPQNTLETVKKAAQKAEPDIEITEWL